MAKMATPVTVPALVGLTVPEAVSIAGPLGLALMGAKGESPVTLTGSITAQRPPLGGVALAGTAVTIWTGEPDGTAGSMASLVS